MTAADPTPTPSMTRRERQRRATMDEIVEVARRLLGDPQGISLRSIASEMGMTAPALYRYVESYDDLVYRIAADIYDDLIAILEAARDRYPPDDPGAGITAASAAFRQWALNNRAEFGLVFTNAATSVTTAGQKVCVEAGQRFGALFSELFVAVWQQNRFAVPGVEELDPVLRERLTSHEAEHIDFHESWRDQALPPGVHWHFFRIWSRLYGTVTLEVYGHVDTVVVETGALFRDMIAGCARDMGLAAEAERLRVVLDDELAPRDE
ncbi:MAG TPA: WHG domain-containing protein [Nocardioidaceae bacterium]|nr:WHG domain-containing protein [Nocardioidaceae bacterium]